MEPDSSGRGLRLPPSLRALRHRNYRIFFIGQFISLTGNWFHHTALVWLVLNTLTNSAFKLGLFQFAQQIPVLLFGLLAGAVADTVNRHRLLICTQALFMLEVAVLGIFTLQHGPDGMPMIAYWSAISLAAFAGVLTAFDLPAREAFLLELVPREDLPNALALNSLSFNAARIMGPSIAGILVALLAKLNPGVPGYGEGMCFVIDALTYIAVLTGLFMLRLPVRQRVQRPAARGQYILDGLRFVKKHRHVSALMGHLAAMALFGIPYLMLIPVFAKNVLHGQSQEFGFLMTAVGMGAVCGGLIMMRRKNVKGLGSMMSKCVLIFCMMVVALALSSNQWVAMGILALAGFFMVMAMIGSQTLVQTVLPEDIRGRVMSIYTMINVGLLPFGNLISGYVAEHLGIRMALIINATLCAIITTYYTLKLPELKKSALESPEYRSAIGLPGE